MYPFKVLNHEDIKAILDMKIVIDIVEKAYVLKENKEASYSQWCFTSSNLVKRTWILNQENCQEQAFSV